MRSLRRQRADVWVLIVSDIGNSFCTLVARGVEDLAQQAGFSVVLCNSDEDPRKEARYLEVAERERVSGVILSPNYVSSDVSRLIAANIPVVQPTYEIGRCAAQLLLKRMTLRPTADRLINDDPTTIMLSTELIARASSRRPIDVLPPAQRSHGRAVR